MRIIQILAPLSLKAILIGVLSVTSMSVGFSQSRVVRDHREIRISDFQFLIPDMMKELPIKGKDTTVFQYEMKGMKLRIELGPYAGKPNRSEYMFNYTEETRQIGDYNAIFVSYRYKPTGSRSRIRLSAVYLARPGDVDSQFSFVAHCRKEKYKGTALEIFNSIKILHEQGKSIQKAMEAHGSDS